VARYKGGVRVSACAALCLTFVALAGCNGGGGEEDAWAGPPEPAADGSVAVDGFADHQQSVDERWERSAELGAAEFLRLEERTAVRTMIAGRSEGEGGGPRGVTVTLDGLLDDSVRAERWLLLFESAGETYALSSAVRTLLCQPGRGHQDFTAEPCV
jgi:hypothetical protein